MTYDATTTINSDFGFIELAISQTGPLLSIELSDLEMKECFTAQDLSE